MRRMMRDLNEMLEARQRGEDPNFEQFMHKWGHFFGPDIKSLDDLLEHMRRQMAAMQQVMQSMTAEQRKRTRRDDAGGHAGRGPATTGDGPPRRQPRPDDVSG